MNAYIFQGFAKFGTHCFGKIDITIRVGLVAGIHIWEGNKTDNLTKNFVIADHKSRFVVFFHWDVANNLVDFIYLQSAIVLDLNN